MIKIKNILTRKSLLNIANKIQPIKRFSLNIKDNEKQIFSNFNKNIRMNFSENTSKKPDANTDKEENKQELNKEEEKKSDGKLTI